MEEDNPILKPYYLALQRLIQNKPQRVAAGSLINKDKVALEAGRERGTLKPSRRIYGKLISAIDAARREQESELAHDPIEKLNRRIEGLKSEIEELKNSLGASMGRELCLLREVVMFRQKLQNLTGAKVVPLKKKAE